MGGRPAAIRGRRWPADSRAASSSEARDDRVDARHPVRAFCGGILRRSGAMLTASTAGHAVKRSRICRLVVLASPSMNTLTMGPRARPGRGPHVIRHASVWCDAA